MTMKTSRPGETRNFDTDANLKRLTNGSVLLAREELQDPNFDATVVLVCIHSKEGAYGLVLNRPSHMPLSEIFDGFNGLDLTREVYIGGPVSQEEIQIVQITNEPVEEAFQVAPRVYMGGNWESISQMIETDSDATHLFLGYSGWAPGQLESEISAGAWDVYTVNLEKLLHTTGRIVGTGIEAIAGHLDSLSKT
jgi:putative transcriptional regulator